MRAQKESSRKRVWVNFELHHAGSPEGPKDQLHTSVAGVIRKRSGYFEVRLLGKRGRGFPHSGRGGLAFSQNSAI